MSVQGPEGAAQRAAGERSAGLREQGPEGAAQRGEAERSAGPREQGPEGAAQRGEAERSAGAREQGPEGAAQRPLATAGLAFAALLASLLAAEVVARALGHGPWTPDPVEAEVVPGGSLYRPDPI